MQPATLFSALAKGGFSLINAVPLGSSILLGMTFRNSPSAKHFLTAIGESSILQFKRGDRRTLTSGPAST